VARERGRRERLLVGGALIGVLLAGSAPAPARKAKKVAAAEDLTNFRLSPAYSRWMVGAAARLASEDEVQGFLRLASDREAEGFLEEFWSRRRTSDSPWPAEQPRAVFERRSREADRLYREGTRGGRTTDRGVTYVLYGEPEKVTFEVTGDRRRLTFEVWHYPDDAPPGLDGENPRGRYYFRELEDGWRLHAGPPPRLRGLDPVTRRPD